jgi:hypothetical protein
MNKSSLDNTWKHNLDLARDKGDQKTVDAIERHLAFKRTHDPSEDNTECSLCGIPIRREPRQLGTRKHVCVTCKMKRRRRYAKKYAPSYHKKLNERYLSDEHLNK